MRTFAHSIIDWVLDGCPYTRPFMWLDAKLIEFGNRTKRRWMRWLADELTPYLPKPEIVMAEIVPTKPNRWRTPKPAKCVNTTSCSSGTVVSIPIRKELDKTTAIHREDTVVETRKMRMEVKPVQIGVGKLDPATANLPNQDLSDMLKALGAKTVPQKPENTYRARLLEAVEGALYKPTKKVRIA